MASCTECVHVSVCRYYTNELAKANGIPLKLEEVERLLESDDCENFKNRARFVELPDDFPKGRLTTDNPLGNFDALMNFAYAKGGQVLLRYANNQENMDLCDYIAFHTKGTCNLSAQEVLDGACFECDDFSCSLGRVYISAIQAAELRERLKMFEDLSEQALKEREENG